MRPFLLRAYVNTAVFLLGAVALVVPSGYSIGAVMLVLGSITLLVKSPIRDVRQEDILIIAVLAFYAAVGIAEAWWDSQGVRGLDKPSRFLLAIPALLLVIAYPPRLHWMWAGLALGASSAGSLAAWQRFVEGAVRAGGHTQIIQFGNISLLMGVLCLAGMGWAMVQPNRRFWIILLLLGATGGILGSILSGSRGGWLGLPFMMLVLYRGYGRSLSLAAKMMILTLVVALGTSLYAIPQLNVEARIDSAVNDLRLYFSEDNPNTSVGRRLEMWRGAWQLSLQSPITGVGSSGYESGIALMVDEGTLHQSVLRYDHAHNEFFDTLAKRGMVGLIALLLLYLTPMLLFSKKLSAHNMNTRSLAISGTILPVAYIDFSLTQGFLDHNSGVMIYSFWLAVLWGAFVSERRLHEADNNQRPTEA